MESVETKPQKWRRAGHLIGDYLSLLRDEERLRDRTIARYRNALNKFACYCEVNYNHNRKQSIDEVLLSVGKPFAESFKNSLLHRKAKKRSTEPTISALRHFYGWLAETNQVKQNPFGNPHAKRTREICLLRLKPKAKQPIAITLEQVKLKRKEPETRQEKRLDFLIANNWPKTESHLIRDFLVGMTNQYSVYTIVAYYDCLNKFSVLCRDISGLNEKAPIDMILLYIDRKTVETNIEKLRSECSTKGVFKIAISAVRTFYQWLLEQGHIDHNPILHRQPPRPEKATITLEQTKLKRKEPTAGISIIAAVEKWLAYNKRHAEHTQRHYHDIILWFVGDLPDDILTIAQLTSAHLRDFVTDLLSKGRKHNTINTHLIVLRSFARWLSEQYDMDNVATKVRGLKAEPPQSRFLSQEEYQKVLSVCNGRDKEIIELLGNTGLRASELLNLKWGNISQDYKMINLTGKGRKFRHIPCNDVVQSILRKYPRQADSERLQLLECFPNKDFLYRVCCGLAKRAGIEKFGPHAIRHYLATELLKREVPIYYVSKLLGHSSVVLTERLYAHFQPEFLNGITDCLTGGAI